MNVGQLKKMLALVPDDSIEIYLDAKGWLISISEIRVSLSEEDEEATVRFCSDWDKTALDVLADGCDVTITPNTQKAK